MARNNSNNNNSGRNANRNNYGNKNNRGENKGRGPKRNDRTYEEYADPSTKDSTQGKPMPSDTVNNKEWWTRNGQVVYDSAAIPQQLPVGAPLRFVRKGVNLHFSDTAVHDQNLSKYALPGICAIETVHGPGVAYDETAAVNQAFLSRAEFVRAQITPNISWDYADLGVISLALGECYAWYFFLRRLYAVIRTYAFTNRYLPEALVTAMGVNFDDVRQHLAEFRLMINQFVIALGAFPIPESNYYDRLQALYDNIFIDEESDKAQIYIFNPYVIRTYDPTDERGSTLVPTYIMHDYYSSSSSQGRLTYTRLRAITQALVASIRNDDDVMTIFGNIRDPRTWGNNVYAIPQISEDYTVAPTKDLGILAQIMNSVSYAGFHDESLEITQNPAVGKGYIKYTPEAYYRCPTGEAVGIYDGPANIILEIMTNNYPITWYGDNHLSPEDVIYFTRFTSRADTPHLYSAEKQEVLAGIYSGGIEILGVFHFYHWEYPETDGVAPLLRAHGLSTINLDAGSAVNNLERIALLSAFNWHPTFWFLEYESFGSESKDAGPLVAAHPVQQWDNVALLTEDVVENIQWVATYSLWGVDQSSNYLGK